MRVAVIYFSREQSSKLYSLAQSYSQGVAKQGHDVAVYNGLKDQVNLFAYDYLIFGAEAATFFSSKIDVSVQQGLKGLGHMEGKPCYAFLLEKGMWNSRSMQLWMRWLESCGLLLRLSDIVKKPSEAKLIGEKLSIYK